MTCVVALGLASLALAGCINTDATIFVDVSLVDPAASVSSQVLGTSLSGGFGLDLHLGPRAAGDSTITLGAFSITNADRTHTIVASLPLASSPAFPVRVAVDSSVNVAVTFSTGANLLPAAAYAELCAASGIVLSGSFDDSLLAGTTLVASTPFHPGGCP